MNPNHPYGYGPPSGRRHDPYGRMPPMNPHPGYQHYYTQNMGPMMQPYGHYQQQWYPGYQPAYQQPYPGPRQQYYPSPMMHSQQMQPMPSPQGPLVVSSHPQMPQTPNRSHQQPYPPSGPGSSHHSDAPSVTSVQHEAASPSKSASETNTTASIEPATPIQAAPVAPQKVPEAQTTEAEPPTEPFNPPIPWLSVTDSAFPPRAARSKRTIPLSSYIQPLCFPPETAPEPVQPGQDQAVIEKIQSSPPLPVATPTTVKSDTVSDAMSTQPTTPSSAVASAGRSQVTPTQQKATRFPVIPVIPVMLTSPTASRKARQDSIVSSQSVAVSDSIDASTSQTSEATADATPAAPAIAKSWADLVRKQSSVLASPAVSGPASSGLNGISTPKSESLGDVLGEINVTEVPDRIAFLQPRGLVNTGNMCYMNSVLQVLVFCTPFYGFLDKVALKAAHAFKSTTPLVDAMIMFMKEYNPIDTATSVEQLRLRLKPDDYEKYGDSLRPDFVYDTINKLPRFRDMRRGHQQDAQEFLGFLLEELHEECSAAMQKAGTTTSSGRSTPVGSVSNVSENVEQQDGWLEVGHKQRAAITRSSGAINSDSPVTNIFGGKLRSELKISGNKLSVTLEPYQPLQLDIGSPQVSNIIDALKGLTKPESMQGDFQSTRGTKTTATKQVFIETLPPVLILHLKRFQYDATTKRAEKIWKKVGYPLELEIPKEVFQPNVRARIAAHGGMPRYKLTGVIYHHGKNANGGHYTVDIRRQDGREWIRMDDTIIRRIRSEDVAEGGSEEDPKILAAALETHKKQALASNNRYENIEADEEEEDSGIAWSQVANGHGRSKSTVSAIMNGTSTPKDASGPQTPRYKDSVKDNKVAYLLFYQRINA